MPKANYTVSLCETWAIRGPHSVIASAQRIPLSAVIGICADYGLGLFQDDLDKTCGDRINQLVFIGKGYQKAEIVGQFAGCLDV